VAEKVFPANMPVALSGRVSFSASGAQKTKSAVFRAGADQILATPTYVTGYFYFTGLLEGMDAEQMQQKARDNMHHVWGRSLLFWCARPATPLSLSVCLSLSLSLSLSRTPFDTLSSSVAGSRYSS
jgi:hypothetical protein